MGLFIYRLRKSELNVYNDLTFTNKYFTAINTLPSSVTPYIMFIGLALLISQRPLEDNKPRARVRILTSC